MKHPWFRHLLGFVAVAVLVHLLAIWAAPRLIMRVVLNGSAAQQMDMQNKAAFPPPVTAASRAIVMPSPDLLYSVCVFDVSAGPVRVTADPRLPSYWSVALYAANSDNFFVINDRQAGGKPVDLWLVPQDGAGAQGAPAGSTVVTTPSTRGFLLMRVLTGNYDTEKDVVEPARHTLTCTKA